MRRQQAIWAWFASKNRLAWATDQPHPAVQSESTGRWRPLLWLLAAATFLIFFQAFMIAPLIPRLSVLFGSTPSSVGWAVPAYLIPYGVMTLVWGPLSDRVGRGPVILASLGAFVVLTAATASVDGTGVFIRPVWSPRSGPAVWSRLLWR